MCNVTKDPYGGGYSNVHVIFTTDESRRTKKLLKEVRGEMKMELTTKRYFSKEDKER